jgi:LPPG:FO 2-phospho-L-lactate transferase
MAALRALGEEGWFNLGDRDLGMHVARSHRLRAGETLSAVTTRLARALGIAHPVAPMSDQPVSTEVEAEGTDGAYRWTEFQRWFVGDQCRPALRGIRFAGADAARMSPALATALARPDLGAVVFCPSNPFLSVDPILAVPGVVPALAGLAVPRIAVSPLIGGQAVKGPLAKLLAERGQGVDNMAIARHYGALVSHLVIDRGDAADAAALRGAGLCVTVAETMMRDPETRAALALTVLAAVGIEPDGMNR